MQRLLAISLMVAWCACSGTPSPPDPQPNETRLEDEQPEPSNLPDRRTRADMRYTQGEVHYVRLYFQDGLSTETNGDGVPLAPDIRSVRLEPQGCAELTYIPLRTESDHFEEVTKSSGPYLLLRFEGTSPPDQFVLHWKRGDGASQRIAVGKVFEARETNNLVEEYALYTKNMKLRTDDCAAP